MKTSLVFIITGRQGQGKTTKLAEVTQLLKNEGQNIFGFYAIGEWENGQRSRFHIIDVNSGKKYLLCKRQRKLKTDKGNFFFISRTIEKGAQIIADGMKQQKALAVIDEIGRFEISETVWYSIFRKLLFNRLPVLITVRESLLKQVIDKFGITHPVIFSLENKSISIAAKIISQLTNSSNKIKRT